jgi:hypothetical protein
MSLMAGCQSSDLNSLSAAIASIISNNAEACKLTVLMCAQVGIMIVLMK